jgi:hypothetical protein
MRIFGIVMMMLDLLQVDWGACLGVLLSVCLPGFLRAGLMLPFSSSFLGGYVFRTDDLTSFPFLHSLDIHRIALTYDTYLWTFFFGFESLR